MLTAKQALSHIRVLDLSRVLAAPWSTQTLGDLGADVIKVEKPFFGDDTRAWGPPFLRDSNGNKTQESAYYLSANRNKRSIAIDFTKNRGKHIIQQLAKQSDVLIENFKPNSLLKYQLDYESLSNLNPRLVYCSITGFGQHGPRSSQPGYDFMIQAWSGLMSITGHPINQNQTDTQQGPVKVGVAVSDLMTGMYATVAILAALMHRDKVGGDGKGQYIDISLADVQVAALANQAMNYLIGGEIPSLMGNVNYI
eukprot:TRINITY_DN1681_c1_g1_i3.p1 TRINITY_DN1681_c1_g1~~TRINITY_DN1681_c1_g1_i3.p1  ORF type:complete len:253 (-),score=105.68 TRINITY_DN1681_c1_g1_i3:561-1319(-)